MVYIIYDYFFPAYKAGGPTQSLVNLVKQIHNEVEIKIICSNKDLDDVVLPVEENRWIKTTAGEVFYSSNGFNSYKKFISKESPIFFINGIFSFQYNFLPLLFLSGRKIVSARGMLHKQALAQKSLKKRVYLFLWKMFQLHKKCEFHATSNEELVDIEFTFGKKKKTWLIPNLPGKLSYTTPLHKQKGNLILGTVALISPMKNYLFVLKALQSCKSNIVYNIYGLVKDKAYWNECVAFMKNLPENVVVKYHGDIPNISVQQALSDIHVYIQPSKSENFGHSIYEALSLGRPVITSHNTPWNGLESAKAGYNTNPDSIVEITQAIESLADMGNEDYILWSLNAHKYCTDNYNAEDVRKRYIEMFNANQKEFN